MNREERLGQGPRPRWGRDRGPSYQEQSGYDTGGYGGQWTPYGYGSTSAYHHRRSGYGLAYGSGGYGSQGWGCSGYWNVGYGGSRRGQALPVQRSESWGKPSSNSLLSSRQGRSPSSYQRSDERIRDEIRDRLRGQKDIDVSDTDCNVTEGTVVLSGTVSGRRERRLIEELAASIWGVKGVRSNLRVRSAADTSRNPG
jgi:BON domain